MTVQSGSLEELGAALLALSTEDLAAVCAGSTPEEMEAIEAALAQPGVLAAMSRNPELSWRDNPAAMAAALDEKFQKWRYVEYLSQKFKDAVEGRSKRQIWSLPARFSKSLLASQWGPVWALDRSEGRARFILNCYGKGLAVENAVGIRDRLNEHQDVLRCSLKQDRRRMDRFVTENGGGVVASGRASVVRGFGAGQGGGIVVDDPFKDWQEAHSAHTRNLVWNQYRGTLLDRLDDAEAFILVVHHRVHEDDLTGRLLVEQNNGGEVWEHVVLPALAVENDPLGRAPGEALEPERFSVAFVQQQAKAMGSYQFAALQMQNPSPEEGNELLRSWFDLVEQMPASFDASCTSWDLKLTDREVGDFVVGQAWLRTGPDYWLRDQLRGKWDHATTANAIALLAVRNPDIQSHVIEAAGAADDVLPQIRKPLVDYEVSTEMAGRLGMSEDEREAVQALRRRGMSGLIRHRVTAGSKSVRARTFIAPAAEAGNVHLPAYAEWLPRLLDELASFGPGCANDDMVDAMSMGLQRLSQGQSTVRAASGDLPRAPISTRGQSGMVPAPPARNRRNVARTIIPRGPFPSR